MKLRLLAEDRTKQETIEYLLRGIQKVIPVHLDLSIISERYSLKKDNLLSVGQESEEGGIENIDGFNDLGEEFAQYNLSPIGERFAPKELDEYLLILTHSSFVYRSKDKAFLFPKFTGIDPTGNFVYNGNSIDSERIFLVGGKNSPSDNNVKVACHEITHELLDDPIKGAWTKEGIQAIHCDNYIGNKRCIMNTPSRVTNKVLEKEIYLGFCQPCTDAMKESIKLN